MNQPARAPLGVVGSIGPLYARVLGNPMVHVRLGAPFLVVLVVLDLLFFAWLGPAGVAGPAGAGQGQVMLALFLFLIVTVWVSTLYAVRWHRHSLLGESDFGFLDIAPRQRDWAYFGYSILVGLVLGVAAFVLSFVASMVLGLFNLRGDFMMQMSSRGEQAFFLSAGGLLMLAIIGLPCLYLFARWCLVFPGRAIGMPMTLTHSWLVTQGQGWRIAFLILAMVLPVQLLASLVPGLIPFAATGFVWTTQLIASVVVNLFLLITIALGQSALSHTYAHLGRMPRGHSS
ncbi:MAG: hypothetical protein RLO50_09910 [Azospirillaceae bacterium]